MIKRIALILIIVFYSLLAEASIYLYQQNSNVRSYVTLTKKNDQFTLKDFSQIKGDYQEKKFEKNFKSLALASSYLKTKYPKAQLVSTLEFWPIYNTDLNKGLFGKKHNNIWEAKNQWNMDWEQKYARWIESEIGPDFYAKRNISTDCADALVGLRWIFARINSLPVANTLSDSGNLFGHYSMNRKWAKLKKSDNWYEDEVFMAALSYVMDLTSTRTVIRDGYPIKISADALMAGTYFITLNENGGHAKIVSKTNFSESTDLPIYTYASTSPRAVRNLALEIMVDSEWPYKGAKELLAFRWPVNAGEDWRLLNADQHPNYSLEQFDTQLQQEHPAFISYILFKMKGSFDPVNLVQSGILDIKRYIEQRKEVVNNGYAYCSKNGCPTNSEMYEEWSTPSRDSKLLKKYVEIDHLVSAFEYLSPGLTEFWMNQLRTSLVDVEGLSLSLSSVRYLFENNFHSFDPNIAPKDRWGINGVTVLSKWYEQVLKLLSEREIKISQQGMCSVNCDPKSLEWISKNTYSIDTELNKLFVQIRTYCDVISEEQCLKDGSAQLNKIITLNGQTKNLGLWLVTIPKFHSDPRVSFDRRWGQLASNEKFQLLPYFETISVSKNSLALIDFKKVYNLNSGAKIFESDKRLVMDSRGTIYSIESNDIKYSVFNGNTLTEFKSVNDREQILKQNPGRLISFSEKNGQAFFRMSLKDSIIAFRIKDGNLEFIDEYTGNSDLVKNILFMVKSPNYVSFADLEKTKIYELDLSLEMGFKNANKLKVLDYSYPNIIADYDDQEWALHFPVLINLETKTVKKLNYSSSTPYKILFSSAKFLKLFIGSDLNEELPSLEAIKIDMNGNLISNKLSNTLLSAMEIDNRIVFVEGSGNQWGNQAKSIREWTDSIKTIRAGVDQALVLNQILFEQTGLVAQITNLKTGQKALVPSSIDLGDDLVKTQTGEGIGYRFDTSYGEYYQTGGLLNFKSLQGITKEEFIPSVSIYSSLNKENLVDERWRNKFKESMIWNGVLISTGKHNAFWWKAAE